MSYQNIKIAITGGAGFIGSHLVDKLMEKGAIINVLDNLSKGCMENISKWIKNPKFNFIKGDCLNKEDIKKAIKDCEIIFHLAANPEVRVGVIDTSIDFKQNIVATYNILEEARKSKTIKTIVFTSTSTIYGEAKKIPTSEDYAPLIPISMYGSSKLACEALISAYCNMFNLKGIIYRLANIIGSRCKHGVIWDFINKLKNNPRKLEILGDGTQKKSYLLVDECTEAILIGLEKTYEKIEIYNIGSEDYITVKEIAEIVVNEMNLRNVEFIYTGGVNGGRGWIGDVKTMLLDISKIKKLGWKPKYNSREAVKIATKQILKEIK
ncbi:MAG: NAD-dependent epimerase/dehydratase family protein [Nitrososphaerota archaeon]